MQLTSQLSLTELLALMQGNLGAITGMNQKLRNVVMKKMGDEDTPEKRRSAASQEADKFKAMLFVP